MELQDIFQVKCAGCGNNATEPYIECNECASINLCLSCYATGIEVREHKSDHAYIIRKNDFPIFENCNWTAREESKLLDSITHHGFGNWEEISKAVQTRNKLECQEHYKKYYIERVQIKELDLLPHTSKSMFPRDLTPFLYNSEPMRDPPRMDSTMNKHLAGYNAFRSDFELNFDNHAESLFNMDTEEFDDDNLVQALRLSVANAYNNRLRERHCRYKIIQQHGLIVPNKLGAWMQQYDKTIGRSKAERLLRFMQFMTGMQFDAFIEMISMEYEKHQDLLRLHMYRRSGIKTLHGAKFYNKIKKCNDESLAEQRYYTSVMRKLFDGQKVELTKEGKMKGALIPKKVPVPLDITDYPNFHILSDSEKDLCSKLRLLPNVYLEIKDQLMCENNKLGYLRLIDARRIVKKDVNKTRKIYDYLMSEGFVTKPINN